MSLAKANHRVISNLEEKQQNYQRVILMPAAPAKTPTATDVGFKCPRTCLGSSDLNSKQWECGLGGKHGGCGADRTRVKANRAPSQFGDSILDICVPTKASRAACRKLALQMQRGHITAILSVPTTELVLAGTVLPQGGDAVHH